jgi:hypothetical protein
MSNIERWLSDCHAAATDSGGQEDDPVYVCRQCGHACELVEYVRADQLTGAVSAVELRRVLFNVVTSDREKVEQLRSMVHEDSHRLGGQSKRYEALDDYLTAFATTVLDTLGSDDDTAQDWAEALRSAAGEVRSLASNFEGAVDRIEDLEQALELLRGHVGTIGAAIIDTALSTPGGQS